MEVANISLTRHQGEIMTRVGWVEERNPTYIKNRGRWVSQAQPNLLF